MTSLSREAFLQQLAQNANGSPEALGALFERALDRLGWADRTMFGPEELTLVGIAMAHQATNAPSAADGTLEALLSKAEQVLGPALQRPR